MMSETLTTALSSTIIIGGKESLTDRKEASLSFTKVGNVKASIILVIFESWNEIWRRPNVRNNFPVKYGMCNIVAIVCTGDRFVIGLGWPSFTMEV